jgi:hypothetical protein
MEHWKVANLICSESKNWKWEDIDLLFNERDREEIRNLALTNSDGADKLIWKFNNKGHYTVKSAYRYAMETLIDNVEYRVPGDWTRMWNLHIPQRIKVFLWRLLRGVLPTRMRLQDRGSLVRTAAPIVRPIMRMIGTFLLDVKRRNKFGLKLDYGIR